MAGANLVQIHGYGVVADRPTNSMPGRLYYATDELILYRDNGTTWDVLASGDSFPSATEGQILMADSGGVFQAVNVTDLHIDTIGGPGGDTNFNGQKIVNMYGPGDPMDAANKDYVDTQIAGITAFDPSTINLNDLANVDTSGVSGGQVLAYFSGTWQPAGLDFLAASPMGLAAGDMYYYSGSAWTLLHTSGAAGKILRAVGSGPTLPGWDDEVSGAVTYDELADVNLTGLSDGDMMVWDTDTARWIPATPGGGGGGSGHEIRDDADSPLTQRTGLQIIVGSSGATLTDDSGGDQTVLDLSAITGGGGAGYKYLALPTGWRDCWDAAVAAQATTPALVAIIGDSFLQGYGSSDWPANGSQNHIAAAIEALVGSGGDFYAPSDSLAFQAGYQGTPPFVVNGSASPQFLSQGFARTLFNGASLSGTNVTFVTPAACTAIDLLLYRYPNAGTFTYTVDGGSPVTVNVTSLTQGQINRVSLTGLANTTHTIVFGNTSAAYTLGLVGIATYRATTGAYVARCGWGGAKIANYLNPALTQLNSEADGSKRLGTKYWRAAANTDALFPANPHLTILALGINDATAGSSREDYRDALSRFIRALRRGRPDMSVLLVAHNYPDTENADAADPGAGGAYAGYVASLYDVAMEQNCGVVNLFAAWGETSYADGLQGNSDFHPTDAGHQDIADMVMAALSASGGGGGGGGRRSGLERIAQVVVGAGGQATVSFTTIPGDYEDLIVSFLARSESGSDDHLHMRFNTDTAGNYDTTYTHNYPGGVGSGLHVDGGTAARPAFIASGSSLSANAAAQGEVTINGYARTFFRKLWRSKSLVDYDGASNYEIMGEYGGIWRSTAAITRIDFFTNNGSDIAEGSVFTLYGRV